MRHMLVYIVPFMCLILVACDDASPQGQTRVTGHDTSTVDSEASDTSAADGEDTVSDPPEDAPLDSDDAVTSEDTDTPPAVDVPLDMPSDSQDVNTDTGDTSAMCDDTRLLGGGIGAPPQQGGYCDEVYGCVDAAIEAQLESLFPDIDCSVGAAPITCAKGVACTLSDGGVLTALDMETLCDASLIDEVYGVECWVWGP